MTGYEIVTLNKRIYAEQEKRIAGMPIGFERLVAEKMILPCIKGAKWMGGLSDRKSDEIYEKHFAPLGYSFEQVYDEFHKQLKKIL